MRVISSSEHFWELMAQMGEGKTKIFHIEGGGGGGGGGTLGNKKLGWGGW